MITTTKITFINCFNLVLGLAWHSDDSELTVPVLLDRGAASDTMDHKTLQKQLHNLCGISGTALEQFNLFFLIA